MDKWRLCQVEGCSLPCALGSDFNPQQFCDNHVRYDSLIAEIERAPHAAELAGDAERLRWGVDVQPPQRPGPVKEWA